MEFPACLSRPNVGNTFGGADCAQTWTDLALWEVFLNEARPATVIELGTLHGGMAIFLAIQCLSRGARFVTADRSVAQVQRLQTLAALGAVVIEADLFSPEGSRAIEEAIDQAPRPLVLFCDDGDKPREVRSFSGRLHTGDFLVVHDWPGEIGPADIPANFSLVLAGQCEATDSLTRFFRCTAAQNASEN